MRDLINDLLDKKMADGTIRKIFDEKIDKLIKEVCDDLTGYGSEAKKKLREMIEPLMINAIERSDFSEFTIKLTDIINNSIKNSSLESYNALVNNVRGLLGDDRKYKFDEDVNISELFEYYQDFVETQISKDDLEDHDLYDGDCGNKYTETECIFLIDDDVDDEHYFSRRAETKHIVFTNSLANDYDKIARKTVIKFDIYKTFSGKMNIKLNSDDLPVDELRSLPPFIIRLITLRNNWCNIILDKTSLRNTIEILFDGEY